MVRQRLALAGTCFAVAMLTAPLSAETDGFTVNYPGTVSVELAISEAELVFKGRTVVTRDEIGVETDGVVIEYFDPSGEVFRWYPGYAAIFKGEWAKDGKVLWLIKKSETRPPLKLCRALKTISGPGYPRSRLRARDCAIWALLRDRIVVSADGDVFELGRMKSPCRMCTSDRAIEIVKKAADS